MSWRPQSAHDASENIGFQPGAGLRPDAHDAVDHARHADARPTSRSGTDRRSNQGRRKIDVPLWLLVGWAIAVLSVVAGVVLTVAGLVSMRLGVLRAGVLTDLGSLVIVLTLRFLQRRHNHARPAGGLDDRAKKRDGTDAQPAETARLEPARPAAYVADPRDPPASQRDRRRQRAARPSTPARGDAPAAAARPAAALPDFPVLGEPSGLAREPWCLPVVPTQPAVAADQARIGTLEVRAASVIGPGHRTRDPATPRQDAYRLGRDTAGQHLIIAVADGMSDSPRSDHGATVAVSTAVASLRSELDGGATVRHLSAVALFTDIARAVTGSAQQRQIDPRDVRTGLIVGVVQVSPDERGQRAAWFGHVADVSAWIQAFPAEAGWRQVAGDSKGADADANSLRAFLPFHPGQAQGTLISLPTGAVLAFLTDGVSDAMTQIPRADEWFASAWTTPRPLGAFILDVGFEAKTHQDDRTAVVVWCDVPPPGRTAVPAAAAGRGRERPR